MNEIKNTENLSLFRLEVMIAHFESTIKTIERDLKTFSFHLNPVQLVSLFNAKETYKELISTLKKIHIRKSGVKNE